MAKKNPYLGSTLEGLLREDGTYEDAKNQAIKSVLAYKLDESNEGRKTSPRHGCAERSLQPVATQTRPVA